MPAIADFCAGRAAIPSRAQSPVGQASCGNSDSRSSDSVHRKCHFSDFCPDPVQRIRGFVARRIPRFVALVAHTAHFCRILPHSARRIRQFVARQMPFFRFLPKPVQRIRRFVALHGAFCRFYPNPCNESVDSLHALHTQHFFALLRPRSCNESVNSLHCMGHFADFCPNPCNESGGSILEATDFAAPIATG
jgi:hypothetical protein